MANETNAGRVYICEGCLQTFTAGWIDGEVFGHRDRFVICPECYHKLVRALGWMRQKQADPVVAGAKKPTRKVPAK
jgi:hypothetical protein